MGEQVLVVPSSLVTFQGFSTDTFHLACTVSSFGRFLPREDAERDVRFKQVIPYVVFTYNHKLVMSYVRGSGSGEGRLMARRSVGIGGHINPLAGVPKNDYLAALVSGMRREIDEEVRINSLWTGRTVGVINEDKTDVGHVHVGLVYHVTVHEPSVFSNEPDKITDIKWTPVSWLRHPKRNLELWSQIVLQGFLSDSKF